MGRWSHSRLNCILSNPMEYYLNYVQEISPIRTSNALSIGSAVHWGIEHNTEDLSEYTERNFRQRDNCTEEQILAESMIHGYLKKKDEIFNEVLNLNNEKLDLLEETHEVEINADIKSFTKDTPNQFHGIIDLLLLTNKGFIILDYKTSSKTPDWDGYLEQLYRYLFLLKFEFPEIPVIKIGIINLKKSGIRQKKTENELEFLNRLKLEYELDDNLIEYHEFLKEDIDEKLMEEYIINLSKTIDFAEMIAENKIWYINFTAANGMYKSQYWDIFYQTPGAENLFKIKDTIWDEDDNEFKDIRNCIGLDMKVINSDRKILNHYNDYKNLRQNLSYENIINNLKDYIYDENLIKKYELTYKKEVEYER